MAKDRQRVFSLFLGTLVVAALLSLDLAFGHASLWIYGPEVVSGRYFEDPAVGRLLLPGARVEVDWREHPTGRLLLRINAAGFREDEPTSLAKISRRVMVFGDSHTEGMVYNAESFPNVAERLLREAGTEIEVINAGVGMFSMYQQLLWLQRNLELDPDLAVLTFYVGNDYIDMTLRGHYPHLVPKGGSFAERRPYPHRSPAAEVLRRYSLGFRALNDWWRDGRRESFSPLSAAHASPGHEADRAAFGRAKEVSVEALGQSFGQAHFFRNLRPEEFETVSRMHGWILDRILALAEQTDVSVAFLILPSKYQAERETDLEKFATLEEILALDPGDRLDDRVEEDFRRLLRARGLEPFEAPRRMAAPDGAEGGPLYWQRDHHLSVRGHRVLGEVLAETIRRELGG